MFRSAAFTVFLLTSLLALPMGADALELREKLPAKALSITMENATGPSTSIGKVVEEKSKQGTLVIFSCNRCPYVGYWNDRIIEIGNGAAKQGIGVIVLNSNTRTRKKGESLEDMKAFAGTSYQFPYVLDRKAEIADMFDAGRTPEVYLFDKQKQLVYRGGIDDSQDATKVKEPHLKNAMKEVSETGTLAETKTVRSIGCTIKK